mgnify:CR=1 FL=1
MPDTIKEALIQLLGKMQGTPKARHDAIIKALKDPRTKISDKDQELICTFLLLTLDGKIEPRMEAPLEEFFNRHIATQTRKPTKRN